MKFVLKELQLFFPFIFPMYWISPRDGDDLIIEEAVTIKKQLEYQQEIIAELTARVKKLEDKNTQAEKEEYLRLHPDRGCA